MHIGNYSLCLMAAVIILLVAHRRASAGPIANACLWALAALHFTRPGAFGAGLQADIFACLLLVVGFALAPVAPADFAPRAAPGPRPPPGASRPRRRADGRPA